MVRSHLPDGRSAKEGFWANGSRSQRDALAASQLTSLDPRFSVSNVKKPLAVPTSRMVLPASGTPSVYSSNRPASTSLCLACVAQQLKSPTPGILSRHRLAVKARDKSSRRIEAGSGAGCTIGSGWRRKLWLHLPLGLSDTSWI